MSNSCGDRLPLTLEHSQTIQSWLIRTAQWRDLAILTVGVDSHLRASDLLRLKVSDLTDIHGETREKIFGPQKKNKPTYEGYLSAPTREAVRHWIDVSGKSGSDYLFTALKSRIDQPENKPISREALGRRVKYWVSHIGLDPAYYSTKSLRKSRIGPILEAANFDYQVPQQVLNHSDIRSTIYYCKIAKERAFEISRSVQFFEDLELPPLENLPKHLTTTPKRVKNEDI